MDVPVLFVVFNRPNHTQQSFDAIRAARPSRLYIAADGPRPNRADDLEKVSAVRDIVRNVDWDCEVKRLFREKNLGCGLAVSEAITWLFKHEECGIILEDDCMPSKSFFKFCAEMLHKYADDTRIMHVSGYNEYPDFQADSLNSYFFSNYGNIWGWATWRRAWDHYDFHVKAFPEIKDNGYLTSVLGSSLAAKYYCHKVEQVYSGKIDTWDYQWEFMRMINSSLSIIPRQNMVQNVGFGAEATHTLSPKEQVENNKAEEISFPLQHPPFIIRNKQADDLRFRRMMQDIFKRKTLSLLRVPGYTMHG